MIVIMKRQTRTMGEGDRQGIEGDIVKNMVFLEG